MNEKARVVPEWWTDLIRAVLQTLNGCDYRRTGLEKTVTRAFYWVGKTVCPDSAEAGVAHPNCIFAVASKWFRITRYMIAA
ncbi:hypothetical protein [Paraburkholderia aromaticivorans]|uniref:hypothetical protein n=1 Tax=Paraburkholderia aromaticivorans TaxID=2026199 RepID=UPI0038BBA06C